jgi:dihydropyrimidinase
MRYDLVVADGTVVSPEAGTIRADVGVADERIACLAAPGSLDGDRVIDATGKHVIPGVVDPHTHHGFYREYASDADTESRSALVGGITTIGNMFRTGDPYTEVIDDVIATGDDNYRHDYFLTLGPLSLTHVKEIPELVSEYGITTYKWLQHYKGTVRERFGTDHEMDDHLGDAVVRTLASIEVPTTLGYHSENTEMRAQIMDRLEAEGRDSYAAFAESFPGYVETQSMVAGAAIAKAHDYDDRFYAVHISSRHTAEELAHLRHAGYRLTGETCPHYLALTVDEADDRAKVGPPVRTAADRDRLWEALADGTISCIGTDHICNRRDRKVGETIWDSLRGFPSNATMLPILLSMGVNEGRLGLERVVEIVTKNNAQAWNLYPRKGTMRVGTDADLVVVDLDETKTVTPALLQSAADYSPYEGVELTGWPTHTIVRGTVAFEDDTVTVDPGHGSHIERPVPTG